MASSILFINEKGDILIFRKFRDDVSRKETANFTKIVATKEVKETPMVEIDGVTFMHTTVNDVTVVATTKTNCNVTMIIEFLYQLVILCKAFIGGEFNENSIRKNFVLIYELLDEVMDYGLPQILEPDVLKLYITTGKVAKKLDNIEKLKQITIQATGAIPWRSEGIRYR
jgi:AP-2 complex subunit mu-1